MHNNSYSLLPIINITNYLFIHFYIVLFAICNVCNVTYVNLLIILFYSMHFIQLLIRELFLNVTIV